MTTQSLPDPTAESPMFLGQFERGVDKKGRVTLPASFREALQDQEVIVTKGMDPCLFLFTKDQFNVFRQKLEQMGITNPRLRRFRRHFFSSASKVKLDGMGRINIPQYLRTYAGLTGDVIIAGADTYIEIWDAERWEQEQYALYEEEGVSAQDWEGLGI